MSTARGAMEQAQGRLEQTAKRLAAATDQKSGDAVDLSAATVNLLSARQEFSTSTRVAHVADELQKSLLDLLG